MVKLIMDSGKEYEVGGTLEEAVKQCYEEEKIQSPYGLGNDISFKKFAIKFIKITDNICINTNHISSIEYIE